MSKYKVYLIEDCMKNANETLAKLNEVAPKHDENKYMFEFELIKGTVPQKYDNKDYCFYEKEDILEKIEERIKKVQNGDRMGLLLDVLLTKEDMAQTLDSYYPQASISRDIFFKFSEDIPIYIVTETSAFGGQSDIIMGTNLSEQYINQQRLVRDSEDTLKAELYRLFSFYLNFKKK